MLPGNMMRVLCAVAGVAMVFSGCAGCGGNPPADCTDTTITFETPTADQTVDSPFEVSVSVKLPDGAAFGIDSAQLKVSDGAPIDGTVSGNRATFSGVTAAPGSQSLSVTIAKGSCSKSSSPQTITVRDACTSAKVTAVSFPQDAAPLGTLNRTELPPGTDLQVKVDAACVSGVQVRIKRGPMEVSPLTSFVNGSATITLAGIPANDNERVDLFAELVRNGTAVNTEGGNPEAKGSIQISRALPSCALAVPAMCLGPTADADNMAAGFQLRVTGTMAMGSTGTMTFDGRPAVPVTPSTMTGDFSSDFTLASSGTFMATVSCTDAAGNTNTATASYCVDFTPPTVSITSPANVDGGATMVVTQSPQPVTIATDAEDGSLVEIFRNGTSVATGTVSGGVATVNVPFGADGTFTLTVHVTDRAGNEGTATLVVTVALTGCGAEFSRPMACPALLTPAQMPGGTYSFQTTSKPACANQPAALFRSDVLADGGAGAEVAAGTTTLTAAGLATYAGLTLTSGDYVFRGQVTNIGPDAGIASVSCQVTVDLDGPSITNPVVPTGQPYATINAAQDTQTSTPGVQRVLTFSARVPVGGRVDVCTTQALNPNAPLADGGFQTRPTSVECGSGWYVLQQGVTSPANGFSFPDGTYDVKIVVVGGGLAVAPASAPVSVFVDSVRPCVNGITRSLPQDLNGDNRLSIAELAGGPPRMVFGLGCGDTSPANLDAAGAVTVRDIVGGVASAVRPSTAVFASGSYTVTLTGTYSTEVDLDLFVELTDLATNRNQLQPTNDPGRFTFRVDPVAPACNITSPSAALLGSAQVPGGNLDVIVATSADVSTGGVNITFTGQAPRSLTPTLSQAQTTYALTGDASYTIGATCTDQSGNVGTATGRTTRVDLVAPTCNITAPVNNSASSVNDINTTVAVTGLVDNDVVTLASTVAGISNNVLTVSGGTATRLVHYANGAQTVTASAVDAAGNACVAPTGGRLSIALTVNSTSCNLDFNGGTVITNARGSWINRVSAANPGGTSPATVSIGAVTSDCGAGRNVYLYQGAPSATPSGTPQVTSAGGTVAFAGTAVSDGQQWTITIDNGTGVLTHRSFIVSFAMPSITSIGLQRSTTDTTVVPVAANAALLFGAATGNRRVETATATDMVFADLDGATADAQFQLTLTGIDGARAGNLNADLDVLEGTTPLMATVPVTAAPFTPTLPRLRLGHRIDDTTTTLVIRVSSPAGNVLTSTHTSEVDVIAPSAPSVTQNLTSARAATVGLSWAPVYDDGASAASGGLTGGTPAAGYDVRWTTSSVPLNNSMGAEADFFGTSSKQDGITAWSAGTINKPLTLPPINTYFIAVRARDEVGNYSLFAAPTSVANPWTEITLTAAVASSNFGQTVMAAASLNADVLQDLVVTAPAEAGGGAVYVYFGASGFSSQTGCVAGCQRLAPSDATAGNFGSDVSTSGNAGDVAAEAKPDLLVSQVLSAAAPNNGGRVVLYFGSTSATLNVADAIELRGDSTFRIGFASRFVRDLDGDGLDEIAVSAPVATVDGVANRGRVFIYKGRSRAQWAMLRTATDPVSMVPFVPVGTANADFVINGPNPILVSNGNAFGLNRHGWASLGDINSDGVNDLAIPTSRPNISKYRVYSGAAIRTSTGASPLSGDSQILEFSETPTAETTVSNGLGATAVSGLDFIDSVAHDLVTSFPSAGRVYVYSNPVPMAGSPAPVATISGPASFGFMVSGAPINGADSTPDLIVGLGNATNNEAWVVYRSGAAFESSIGTTPAFWVSRFVGSSIVGTSTTSLGRSNAVGDVDGVNGVDVVLGDDRANLVKVWR